MASRNLFDLFHFSIKLYQINTMQSVSSIFFPTYLQQWELLVSPLQAAGVKNHPRSSEFDTQFPWEKAAGQLGTPKGENIVPCYRLLCIRCPAGAGAHLRGKSRLFNCISTALLISLSCLIYYKKWVHMPYLVACHLFLLLVCVLCWTSSHTVQHTEGWQCLEHDSDTQKHTTIYK